MKQKTSKFKRVAITALAAVCALSSVAAFGASAKTYKYTHTVNVGGYSGANDTTWISMPKKGTCYDLFGSYPTIYNNKSSCTIETRACHENKKTKSKLVTITLKKNYPAPTTANYGELTKSGQWLINYKYKSGGGFKSQVITHKQY